MKRKEGVMFVNIHPNIVNMMEEAKWMQRLGLEVPPAIHQLSLSNVKCNHDQFKV